MTLIAVAAISLVSLIEAYPVEASAPPTSGMSFAGTSGTTLVVHLRESKRWRLDAFDVEDTNQIAGYELLDSQGVFMGFGLKVPTTESTLVGRSSTGAGSAQAIQLAPGKYFVALLAENPTRIWLHMPVASAHEQNESTPGVQLRATMSSSPGPTANLEADSTASRAARFVIALSAVRVEQSIAAWQQVCITRDHADCAPAQLADHSPDVTPSSGGSAVEFRESTTQSTGFGKLSARCHAAAAGDFQSAACAIVTLR